MQIIAHRKNTIQELKDTPVEFGVEVDIRSFGKRLIVQHDPFIDAVDFEDWIKHYRHQTLILNIKEEGIEGRAKDIAQKHGISDFFFLDLSFPYLIKLINSGDKRAAMRFSEYESVETCMALAGKVDWVWIDCFNKMPLTKGIYYQLSKQFKLCLVSPELQGRDVEEIKTYRELLKSFRIDAVCTKRSDLWQ